MSDPPFEAISERIQCCIVGRIIRQIQCTSICVSISHDHKITVQINSWQRKKFKNSRCPQVGGTAGSLYTLHIHPTNMVDTIHRTINMSRECIHMIGSGKIFHTPLKQGLQLFIWFLSNHTTHICTLYIGKSYMQISNRVHNEK